MKKTRALKLYKVVLNDLSGPFTPWSFEEYLPQRTAARYRHAGKWLPKRETLISCAMGWHYCTGKKQLKQFVHLNISWTHNFMVFEVEVRGKCLHWHGKSCAQQLRLVKQVGKRMGGYAWLQSTNYR